MRGSSAKTQKLPSGGTIGILSVTEMHFSNSDPALMLKYETTHWLDDKVALQKEAAEVWTLFEPMVEKRGFHNAILSANDAPRGVIITTNSSYSFVYKKDADGTWHPLAENSKP